MNDIIQNILVFTSVGIAVYFLLKKFVKPAKATKSCGQDDCGCH